MKRKTQNMSVGYDPEQVTTNVEIGFRKTVRGSNTTIVGTIRKNGESVGSASYDAVGNYMIAQLKPFDALTEEEVAAVYSALPRCFAEIVND